MSFTHQVTSMKNWPHSLMTYSTVQVIYKIKHDSLTTSEQCSLTFLHLSFYFWPAFPPSSPINFMNNRKIHNKHVYILALFIIVAMWMLIIIWWCFYTSTWKIGDDSFFFKTLVHYVIFLVYCWVQVNICHGNQIINM